MQFWQRGNPLQRAKKLHLEGESHFFCHAAVDDKILAGDKARLF
jgi:hypothetical protein